MVIIRPLTVPDTGIQFQDANIEAFLGDEVLGKGTLFITEEAIFWIKQNSNTNEGFIVQYKKMTLHAISRDPNLHPRGCLYVMINGTLDEDQMENECPAADDEEEMTELRLVPEDESRLDLMYKAVQDCTLLHPDPSSDMSGTESGSDDEGLPHEDDFEPAVVLPMHGLGGGRIIRNPYDDQDEQIGALRNYFGARLRFEENALGMPRNGQPNGNPNSRNGNGSAHSNQNQPPFDPERFADPE